jgi:opacity protein-like surface antigen
VYVKKLFVAVALLILVPFVAVAQEADHKMEVYGGYQLLHDDAFNMHGVIGAVEGNVNNVFSLVGEFGYARKGFEGIDESLTMMTFLGGPRVSYRADSFRVFGHVLMGGNRIDTVDPMTKFTMAFGGGLDYSLSDAVSIRPTQFDIITLRVGDGFGWENDIRWSAGIVFKFGR